MNIIKPNKVSIMENRKNLNAKKLYSKEEAEIMQLTLVENQDLADHVTPVDVIFYIVEGKGEVRIGDEKESVEKGMMIESPKNIPHGLKNTGQEDFTFLVIKTPRP